MASGTLVHTPPAGRARWMFIVCDAFIVMIDATAPNDTIQRLWELTDASDPTAEDLVGAIPLAEEAAGGGVASFAIVRFADPAPVAPDRSATVVVRGTACVDVFSIGGARRFTAGGVEPWVLAGFRSVVAVGVYGAEVPVRSVPTFSADALPARHAVLATDGVLWAHPTAAIHFDDPLEADPPATPESDVAPELDATPELDVSQRSDSAPQRDAESDDPERTILRAEAALIAPLPGSAGASAQGTAAQSRRAASLDDDTVLLPPPELRNAAEDVGTADTPAHETPRFTIVVGGQAQTLDGPVVVGRRPGLGRIPVADPPTLITVPSPDEQVSASHVRVEPQGDAVVITDLRSTNGTYLSIPGRPRRRLRPGESFTVPGAATVDVGDGNIIEIMPIVTDRRSDRSETAVGRSR